MPAESLRPLFRSCAMAKAFAKKLSSTNRLASISGHGRLVFRPKWWKTESEREDRGSVAQRLARTTTGDDLFDFLRDCTLSVQYARRDLASVQAVWNNYVFWFNKAAAASMPTISRFEFIRPPKPKANAAESSRLSGLHVVYEGDSIYSLRLTAAGVALGEVIGKRPELQPRS